MLNNFIYAQTKDLFLEQLGAGNILDEAIVFIEDTKEIWNHGTFFGRASDIDPELVAELEAAVASLETDKANKSDLPDLSGYLTKTAAESLYATIATVNSELAKKQDAISDLETIRSGAAKGATALQSIPAEYVTESELTAKGYATTSQVNAKQDTITDLATIRANAAKGATALQSVPTEYITETELTGKGYSTEEYVNQQISSLVDSAPETLNTLGELAAALKNNQDVVDAINDAIANKADIDGEYPEMTVGTALATKPINVTHAELRQLRNEKLLVPGQRYRITDYVTKVNPRPSGGTDKVPYYVSAEHPFDIIVTAASNGELNHKATAAIHEGDTYFNGCSLGDWQIWYSLEYTETTYSNSWAAPSNEYLVAPLNAWDDGDGHSVKTAGVYEKIESNSVYSADGTAIESPIYCSGKTMMGSAFGISGDCFWTICNGEVYLSIYFKEDGSLPEDLGGGSFSAGSWVLGASIGSLGIDLSPYFITDPSLFGKGVIYRMIDEHGNDCPYDFKNIQFMDWNFLDSSSTQVNDVYLYTFNLGSTNPVDMSLSNYCSNNKMNINAREARPGYSTFIKSSGFGALLLPSTYLNHNIIISESVTSVSNNVFELNSALNKIISEGVTNGNIFKGDTFANIASDNKVFNVVIENGCERNTINAQNVVLCSTSGGTISENGYGTLATKADKNHTHDEYVTDDELQSALADVKVDVDLSEYAKLTDLPAVIIDVDNYVATEESVTKLFNVLESGGSLVFKYKVTTNDVYVWINNWCSLENVFFGLEHVKSTGSTTWRTVPVGFRANNETMKFDILLENSELASTEYVDNAVANVNVDLSEYAKLSDIPSHDNYLEVVDGTISVPVGITVGSDENTAMMINMGSDGTAVMANKIVGSDFAFGLLYTDYRIRLNDDNRPILYWESEEGDSRTIPFSMQGHTHDEYAIASNVITKDEFSTLQTGVSENELVVSAALADLNERFDELQGGSATQTQITELQQTIQTLQTEIANIKAELVKTLNVE